MSRKAKKVDDLWHARRGVKVSLFLNLDTSKFYADVLDQRVEAATLGELKIAVMAALNAFDRYKWQPVIYVEQDTQGSHGGGWSGRDTHRFRAGLTFEFWRVEIAESPGKDGTWVERPFLTDWLDDNDSARLAARVEEKEDDDDELSAKELAEVKERRAKWIAEDREKTQAQRKQERETGREVKSHFQSRSDSAKRIPYTEAAWQVLEQIRANIDQAGKRLDELLKKDNLVVHLLELGSQFKLLPPAPAPEKKRGAK